MARHTDGKILQQAIDLGLTGFSSMSPRKEVIRSIQNTLGQEPCYATEMCQDGSCKESCEWSGDFGGLVAVWLRR